ncbi:hypothetical protein Taro_045382 [Colocasia esculenta]|uniref:Hexosyltransferase n=1 Tax=Colocasia esculenta TaxID=4460 RepID=A0A843X2N2_COLES|nr:hypothetical protein [Colocasia esculenta]
MTKQQPSAKPSPARPRLTKTKTIALLLLPLFLLVLIGALNFPNEFHLQGLATLSASAFTGFVTAATAAVSANQTASLPAAAPAPSPPAFRLLMGVFTIADRVEERARLRLVRELQPPVAAHIDVKFVLCNLTREEQRMLIALEIMRYDDIMILQCWENVNSGKTYTFFSSLPAMFNGTNDGDKPYDFVMKTDDDTYFRFPELVESLRRQPREDVYWGHVHEAGEHNPLFMRGMGYVLSWDLVEWIATTNVTKNNTMGSEDTLVGAWLRDGGKGKNVYSTRGKNYNFDDTKPVQYDLPWPGSQYTWVPNTISVHRLKDRQKWATTLSYFNVTAGLGPSKLYHLD